MIVFLYCITAMLWTISCVMVIPSLFAASHLELTDDSIKWLIFGMIFYVVILQALNILMLRYFRWARRTMAALSFLSVILMVFAIINFTGMNAAVHYMAYANLIAAAWSCFYFSSPLYVKLLKIHAQKYQSIHGYDPIQWRKDNPRRLF